MDANGTDDSWCPSGLRWGCVRGWWAALRLRNRIIAVLVALFVLWGILFQVGVIPRIGTTPKPSHVAHATTSACDNPPQVGSAAYDYWADQCAAGVENGR
jgi:hypothetical protein